MNSLFSAEFYRYFVSQVKVYIVGTRITVYIKKKCIPISRRVGRSMEHFILYE